MSHSVFVLWLEHVDPALLSAVPTLQQMAENGVDLHLTPQPLSEEHACYLQVMTGMGAGKSGYFDAVKPVAYTPQPEDGMPDGVLGRLLPDVLRARGLTSTFVEARSSDDVYTLAQQAQDCVIVRISLEHAGNVLEDLVRRCKEGLPSGAHLLVLTAVWRQPASGFVNLNNFLADIGLLEAGIPHSRENIDWSETLAYSLGSGQIWVNLRGRERAGAISPGREYQQVCDALKQELMLWRDPETGEAIVKQALKKEEAYSGDYLFKAPDLIVEYHPSYTTSPRAAVLDFDSAAVFATGNGEIAQPRAPHARLIASGPDLVSGYGENAHLVDVLPNIIYLLGRPAPSHVDGRVISALFTPAHRQQYKQEQLGDDEFNLTSDEEGQIEDRLRALGYIG